MELIAKHFTELTTTELYEILKSRAEVFVVEQKIICQEMDNVDYHSLHCFFQGDDGLVLAYLRAFYPREAAEEGAEGTVTDTDTVQIGRVLTLHHGQGLGRRLMEESIRVIRNTMPCRKMRLHAQQYAIGFYEKFGFTVTSEVFLEEGIPHVTMELPVTTAPADMAAPAAAKEATPCR